MEKINILFDSNTTQLKKRVRNYKEEMSPYERNRGELVAKFTDFVTANHPKLTETQATELFKAIISTWQATAPKSFIVELLENFKRNVISNSETVDPAQIKAEL